ncbi:MAG TPA: 4-hydroxybenzoate octaprenyltransferase [Casimicrobiaceae bacterium]|nr:4-hydroxybenzoate octaprenyltransferase [Casimicrobiaceae bacterium]
MDRVTAPVTARQRIAARIDAYERLMRLDKPIGTLLLLWPTLTALWLASDGRPRWSWIIVLAVGTLLMRSAGCAMNDWADRAFDAHVQRTANRPLAAGEIEPYEALFVAGGVALLAFILVFFGANRTVIVWSIPALAIGIAYPFFKRFFALPQAFLGIAFSFGIPIAYAIALNRIPTFAWILLAINLLWVVAYDTEYAMVDRDDDRRIGIRTSALTFGRFDVLAVATCYAMYLAGMAWVGSQRGLGWVYFALLAVAAALAAYHVWLIRDRDRAKCLRAFLHNHWLGFAIFAGVVLDYGLRQAWPRV